MSESGREGVLSGGPGQQPRVRLDKQVAKTEGRYSFASSENGESSTQNSFAVENGMPDASIPSPSTGSTKRHLSDELNHRSHRSRGSGSFLVPNAISEHSTAGLRQSQKAGNASIRPRESGDQKGKTVENNSAQRSKKNRASVGLGIGRSPLATAVVNTSNKQTTVTMDGRNGEESQGTSVANTETQGTGKTPLVSIDVEAAQIVNLALNLSESRKMIARRNVSSPMPPPAAGFGEPFLGNSLKQHLQAQRRSSRNISPKPGKDDPGPRTPSRSPAVPNFLTPAQLGQDFNEEDGYSYNFSSSTLARADKAKKTLELMAQYRRLLEFLPPLRPQDIARSSTTSPPSTSAGSPSSLALHSPYGRAYNPLQYIRNRKVRARERKAIDGEAQGFGDVEKVTAWVDRVAKTPIPANYSAVDRLPLPPFDAADTEANDTPNSSQRGGSGSHGQSVRVKRPRVDWIIDPVDMVADVYWLEQNHHKRLIEDNRERKIFPAGFDTPHSGRQHRDGRHIDPVSGTRHRKKLSLDTRLSRFNSLRIGGVESTNQKARQRVADAALVPTGSTIDDDNLTAHEDSDSELSNEENDMRSRRNRRDATAGSAKMANDVLEKQMLEILAQEAHRSGLSTSDVDAQHTKARTSLDQRRRTERLGEPFTASNRGSLSPIDGRDRRGSMSSQLILSRASLEIDEPRSRQSLEGLDVTAPSSPHVLPANIPPLFVPSIAIDLSPPSSRQSSPTRQPTLEKVKAIIKPFRDESRSRAHSRANSISQHFTIPEEIEDRATDALGVPMTPGGRSRSRSPTSQPRREKRDDDLLHEPESKPSSLRRRPEEPSGIRGFFKGSRNPVQRVSDFLLNKEASPGSVESSNTSTEDDSTTNKPVTRVNTVNGKLPRMSLEASPEPVVSKGRRSYELPTFTSPFDRRGRSGAPIQGGSPEPDHASQRQTGREQQDMWRFSMIKPPQTDVQDASQGYSSDRRLSDRSPITREVSPLGRRRSSLGIQNADARLQSVMGTSERSRRPSGLPLFSHLPRSGSKRRGSVADPSWAVTVAPISRREVTRVRTLLLSSGIKAKEIIRRGSERIDFNDEQGLASLGEPYVGIHTLNRDPQLLRHTTRSQAHIVAAQILSKDIQLSSRHWQESANTFSTVSVNTILERVGQLQARLSGASGFGESIRRAERDADDLSIDLHTKKTMAVMELVERMNKVIRGRRRRFRWVRRLGWVMVEWALMGVMWLVWAVFMVITVFRATIKGVIGGVRWLLWL